MAQLRLIALDAPDVTVLSAHLQDAVLKVADIAYSSRDTRLVAHVNRFNWLPAKAQSAKGERRRAALRIERVTHVQTQGFDRADRSTVLSLLAVTFTPDPDPARAPAGIVTLVCSANRALRLSVECPELVLEDLGPAWAANATPKHQI